MTVPTLDELLAEERADQEATRFTDAMYERTCANADRVPSRVVKERDRARATAVDLEQRLAEVERIARDYRGMTLDGHVLRDACDEILAVLACNHDTEDPA